MLNSLTEFATTVTDYTPWDSEDVVDSFGLEPKPKRAVSRQAFTYRRSRHSVRLPAVSKGLAAKENCPQLNRVVNQLSMSVKPQSCGVPATSERRPLCAREGNHSNKSSNDLQGARRRAERSLHSLESRKPCEVKLNMFVFADPAVKRVKKRERYLQIFGDKNLWKVQRV